MKLICDEVDRLKPERLVLDSLSEIRLMSEVSTRYRRQILGLKHFFAERGTTVLLIDNTDDDTSDHQMKSVAHGVIALEQVRNKFGAERRRLRVVKLRGIKYRGGEHDYVIEKGGIVVFPRLVAAEHLERFEAGRVSSGIAGLDSILGGGLARGTSTLFIGPVGSNKTTIASQFAAVAAGRGEAVSYYTFDETTRSVIDRAGQVGIGMQKHVQAGNLSVVQIDPAELTPGEMASKIRESVDAGTRMVILDSLNGYLNAMPEERFLVMQLHELLTYLSHRGVVTILVLAQHGMLHNMETPADVTYLADAVVMLRYFEAAGEVKKAISVVKKRGGAHETTIRELAVRDNRLVIGGPLKEFQGVLTGVPSFTGPAHSILARNDDERSHS
ncbi:MAG: kaiC [Phycisphaerales bacterium]|nr:kaiC [Phycisphaerales bacterium]